MEFRVHDVSTLAPDLRYHRPLGLRDSEDRSSTPLDKLSLTCVQRIALIHPAQSKTLNAQPLWTLHELLSLLRLKTRVFP
jgi:hypothetical protein